MADTNQVFEIIDAINSVSVEGFNSNYQSIFADLVLSKTDNVSNLSIGELLDIHHHASVLFNERAG